MKVNPVRVGDVLMLQRRAVDVEPDTTYTEIGLRSFGRGIFHKEPVSGFSLGTKRVFYIEPGDLVISNVFAWEGAISLAAADESGKIGSHRFMTFKPTNDRIHLPWAAWFFISEPGLELIRLASPGSAGRNRTLAIDRFEALEIPLPPIDEQRRVVAYLDTAASMRDRTQQLAASRTSDQLLATLPPFTDALIQAFSSGRQKPVANCAEFVGDIVHSEEDAAPANCFIGLQHVESHTGRRTGSDPLGPMKGRKFRFRPGDIVFGYLRPYLNKVWVADRHGLCSVDQYVLRARAGINPELLAYMLRGRATLNRTKELTHSLQLPRLRSGLLAGLAVSDVPDEAVDPLVTKLNETRDRLVLAADRRQRQAEIAHALVPSALNEVFAGLR